MLRRPVILRRLLNACLASWFAIVAIGVPLPVEFTPAKPRDAHERFPCENCHCGCATAEQCWQNCCCHSVAERLAWAKREGVAPPAELLLAATQDSGPTCCRARGVCSARSGKHVAAENSKPAAGKRKVIVLNALGCQGLLLAWHSIDLAPPPPVLHFTQQACSTPAPCMLFSKVSAPSFSPPTPPPQLV